MRKAGVRGGASQTQAATLVLGGEADPIHFLDSTAPLTYAKDSMLNASVRLSSHYVIVRCAASLQKVLQLRTTGLGGGLGHCVVYFGLFASSATKRSVDTSVARYISKQR